MYKNTLDTLDTLKLEINKGKVKKYYIHKIRIMIKKNKKEKRNSCF